MNARIIRIMARNRNNNSSGSMSFSTLHSASPSTSSSDSSSNLDTESTGSLIHDNDGVTLGSLLGVSSILELYNRSLRRAKGEVLKRKKGKRSKSSFWLLCLRSRSINRDTENNHSPSLGQFLALERRAANENRKNQMPLIITAEPNSPKSVATQKESRALGHGNNWFDSFAKMFSCLACVDKLATHSS